MKRTSHALSVGEPQKMKAVITALKSAAIVAGDLVTNLVNLISDLS
jgi:hypothetical protein